MRNLFVKTALVLCTTIIFLPATVFATEPQNTEITSAEEGFTDSDPSVSYENDNSLTLDEKEDDSTSTEPPAEDEKTPDKADTDKENPDPDIFTSGDDFGDGSKSNPWSASLSICFWRRTTRRSSWSLPVLPTTSPTARSMRSRTIWASRLI